MRKQELRRTPGAGLSPLQGLPAEIMRAVGQADWRGRWNRIGASILDMGLKMLPGYPSRPGAWAIRFMSLTFRREVWAEGMNSRVDGLWMVFKVLRPETRGDQQDCDSPRREGGQGPSIGTPNSKKLGRGARHGQPGL